MRNRLAVALLALGSIAVASPAHAQLTQVFNPGALNGSLTTHDFETSAGGPGATYSFSIGSPRQADKCSFAACITPSGQYGLSSTTFPDVLTIMFSQAVGSIGMYFGNDDRCCSNGFTAYLDAYNGAGLVGTIGVVANMNDGADQYLGANSSVGLTYVQVRYGSGSDVGLFTYVDDVAFSTAVVTPEPASMVLMGTGLVGIVGFARRRRKA